MFHVSIPSIFVFVMWDDAALEMRSKGGAPKEWPLPGQAQVVRHGW